MARDREQLESMLSAYLDGELTEQERAEVERFLAADADARRLLDELQATVAGLTALPRAKASDEFADALRSHLERRALLGAEAPARMPRVSAPSPVGRRFAAAAIIALATLAGYFTWSFTREPSLPHHGYASNEEARSRSAEPADKEFATDRTTKGISESRKTAPSDGVKTPGLAAGTAGSAEVEHFGAAHVATSRSRAAGPVANQKMEVAVKEKVQPPPSLGDTPAAPAAPGTDWSLATSAPQEGERIAKARPAQPLGKGDSGSLGFYGYEVRPATAPHGAMPVLGPDLSSRPASPQILAEAADTHAGKAGGRIERVVEPQELVRAFDGREGREAFIVAGVPVTQKAAAPATAPAAARPALSSRPAATRPAPASAPATSPAPTTAP